MLLAEGLGMLDEPRQVGSPCRLPPPSRLFASAFSGASRVHMQSLHSPSAFLSRHLLLINLFWVSPSLHTALRGNWTLPHSLKNRNLRNIITISHRLPQHNCRSGKIYMRFAGCITICIPKIDVTKPHVTANGICMPKEKKDRGFPTLRYNKQQLMLLKCANTQVQMTPYMRRQKRR